MLNGCSGRDQEHLEYYQDNSTLAGYASPARRQIKHISFGRWSGWSGETLYNGYSIFITKLIVVPSVLVIDPVEYVFTEDLLCIGGFHSEGGADGVEAGDAVDLVDFFGGMGNIVNSPIENLSEWSPSFSPARNGGISLAI